MGSSLAERDLERLYYVADKAKISPASWIRNVVIAALNELVDPDVPLECTDCDHQPSEHGPDGCKRAGCRCPKYRRPR